ncbi:MAG: exodeoxyribonuclease III [Thermoplasmatota archaeon]
MKIVSWNINSLRARMERAEAFLDRHEPDVLCLQETKVQDADFPFEPFEKRGYEVAIHGQKSYNGVAIASRVGLGDPANGFNGDPAADQARVLSATVGDGDEALRLWNLYVVNGKAPDHEAFATKQVWLDALRATVASRHAPDDPVLLVGDFNITPDDLDVYDPVKLAGAIHCTPEERSWLARYHDWGLEDLHRRFEPDGGVFTWWDYRFGAFARGRGLRIDLALGTPAVAARCTGVTVDRDERKQGDFEAKPSDHAPLLVHLA